MDKSSLTEELEALFKLFEKGAITKEEYEAQKAILLSSKTETSPSEKAHENQETVPIFIEEPYQKQNESAHSNSVKIILIIIIGLIIIVAMYFIFAGNKKDLQPNNGSGTLSASAASESITVNAQQTSNTADKNLEDDSDSTGLNLNTKTPEELNQLLNKFQQDRAKALANLRNIWSNLDPDFKATIQQEQKDWDNTALTTSCSLTGYHTILAQQVANQYCESIMLNNRAKELLDEQASNLTDIKQEKAAQMDAKASDALKRVNITWSTIPDDIQQNLNQTYEQWSDEINKYCISRPTAKNLIETQINYDNCIINKSENKIKELNGYKI